MSLIFVLNFLNVRTRLLVSGQSPECSDCLLRFYGAVITLKKLNVKKMKFCF